MFVGVRHHGRNSLALEMPMPKVVIESDEVHPSSFFFLVSAQSSFSVACEILHGVDSSRRHSPRVYTHGTVKLSTATPRPHLELVSAGGCALSRNRRLTGQVEEWRRTGLDWTHDRGAARATVTCMTR